MRVAGSPSWSRCGDEGTVAIGQGIVWTRGPSALGDALEKEYWRRATLAVKALLLHFAAQTEAHAKANAPWTDRTGNARQSLFAVVDELSSDVVALYLSHGMEYGKWLELCNQGRYAIILPTLEAYYPQISEAMRALFR